MSRPRILSGMRPTGALHLGNYMGALENWVALQDRYECFFGVVDWHSLTTDYADPGAIRENVVEVATDWLAAGTSKLNGMAPPLPFLTPIFPRSNAAAMDANTATKTPAKTSCFILVI